MSSDSGIAIIGLGKAGLPLALAAASTGLRVVGVDISPLRVLALNKGENPLPEEPGLADILTRTHGKNFIATTEYSTASSLCTTFIVIVPLFIDDDKRCDFSLLDSAFSSIARVLKKNDLVVLETTVPPGTTENRFKPLLENTGLIAGKDFLLAYSPERIMTGYSLSRYRTFPKVVGGINAESGKRAKEVYGRFCADVRLVRDIRTAELIKVAEGVYRDVNIALANELYRVCGELDVDFWEMRAQANHEFCAIHEPGSVGGHCIPVYPWFLIHKHEVPLITLAREVNDEMIHYYLSQIPFGAKSVGVIGLSYRSGVKEIAYTRSIPLLKELVVKGYEAAVYDPLYTPSEVSAMGFKYLHDLLSTDALIIMNAEKSVRDKLVGYKGVIIDVKNIMRGS